MSYGYDIPDAPWITETERTGHYKYGWWNEPDDEDDEDEEEEYGVIDRL